MSDFKLICFEPLDSLFFREAKPFNAGDGGFLDSQFPPPAQTLSGAIRGAMGDAVGIDWRDTDAVKALVGAPGDDPTPLAFAGPYVFKNKQRIFPVPLHLLHNAKTNAWQHLLPSDSTYSTDRGECRLPEPYKSRESDTADKSLESAKPVDAGWLESNQMHAVLSGGLPTALLPAREIFLPEARVGIGRDNVRGVVNDSQLYFTRHVRLAADITLGMALSGGHAPNGASVRLGGEGRLARMTVADMPAALAKPTLKGKPKGLILILLTHGDFNGATAPDWSALPVRLNYVSACIGKAVREGGWDYANRKPKPLKSLVPAGSCYFVTVGDGDLAAVINALHGMHIGQRTKFGYGEIAVGLWT